MTHSGRPYSHEDHEPAVKKRYASVRGQNRMLDVASDTDWDLMRTPPKPKLVCPVGRCPQTMHTVLRNGTRFLRNDPSEDGDGCTHLVPPSGGGGPMTEEHLWLQKTLLNLCLELGYDARLETDYADVRVGSTPPFALEVQLRGTGFEERARQRAERGMRTLWLLPDTARKEVDDPLFSHPAVRVKYMSSSASGLPPWDPQNHDRADLKFGATIWKRSADPTRFIPAGNYQPKEFLREVLANGRLWYHRDELHERSDPRTVWAGWALEEDVSAVRVAREQRDRAQAVVDTAHGYALREKDERRRRADLSKLIDEAHDAARHRNEERYRNAEMRAARAAALVDSRRPA
jgi:hypothetical protein